VSLGRRRAPSPRGPRSPLVRPRVLEQPYLHSAALKTSWAAEMERLLAALALWPVDATTSIASTPGARAPGAPTTQRVDSTNEAHFSFSVFRFVRRSDRDRPHCGLKGRCGKKHILAF
jgi:hypothetical protein